MDYKNAEMKIDQLVSYLNDNKINLSPAFQRGHVWKIGDRRKLLKNILAKKPIPAIFLYKEATGAKYSYNILDGKQRLESIILYIANSKRDFGILKWHEYFIRSSRQREQHSFQVDPKDPTTSFENLNESYVRDFREYSIPTIEISLSESESTSLTDIIALFIDINQQGVPVSRFNMVKALCHDSKILKVVFSLIAKEQRRSKDIFYKMINNDVTMVLKYLRDVQAATDPNVKVDKMWEHLLEMCLFRQTGLHRKPIDIIKGFINNKTFMGSNIDKPTIRAINQAFTLLNSAKHRVKDSSPLFTDYTYLYSVATFLTRDQVITYQNRALIEEKLVLLAEALALPRSQQTLAIKQLTNQAKLHTTDVSKRQDREVMIANMFKGAKSKILKNLP